MMSYNNINRQGFLKKKNFLYFTKKVPSFPYPSPPPPTLDIYIYTHESFFFPLHKR